MSISACGLKTNIQSPIVTNKTTSNTFAFPNSNTHLSCTSPSSFPGVDSTNPTIYDIDTHFRTSNHEQQQQQQQPRDSLPSPHLLLQSTNPISSSSRPNRNSNLYSQTSTTTSSNSLQYSLTSQDQAMDVKPSTYSNYLHYSRSAYDYNRPTMGSPCYESMHEPNSFNSDRSIYQSLPDTPSYSNWPLNSLGQPIKTEPRAEYGSNTDTQHASCTDEFSIHNPIQNHDHTNASGGGGLFPNRTNGPKHFNHSDLMDSSVHLNGHSIEPVPNFQSSNHMVLTNHDASSGSITCRTSLAQRGRISNPTKLGSKPVGRPGRVASATSQPLSIGATSPLGSTTTMTPDSSTTGFTGNRFTCSSDDGEASPAPTCSSGCPQTPGRSRKPAPTLATGRRNLKGELVDPDEADRRMKRRERNRKSAQKCRERKVQRTHELQTQVECLQVEASRLMQELESWRTQVRQCVALLQHHCPGVAIPYLSCLNEFCPTFKESVDSLMDILPPDNETGYLNTPSSNLNWKTKPVAKSFQPPISELANGSRFESNDNNHHHRHNNNNNTINNDTNNNEPNSMLPSMNMIHSQTTPNRSKSLFGFSTLTTNPEKDSMTECLISSERDTSYTTVDRADPIIRSNSSVSIRTVAASSASTCGVGGVASIGAASVGGPASASSSSSCSTYELSLPMIENSLSNLTDNGLFKEFNEPNRSRVRMLSGHETSPNNTGSSSGGTNPTGLLGDTQTWNSQRYDDYSTKGMQVSASKQRMFPHSFDSELTMRCDNQTLSSNRSTNSMEGACYT